MKLRFSMGLTLAAAAAGLLTFAVTKVALKLVPDVKAQSECCSIQPPPHAPDPYAKAWPKNQDVTVVVHERWGADARNEFEAGINSWNGYNYNGDGNDCSGVTLITEPLLGAFDDTLDLNFQNRPPDYHIYIHQRHTSGGDIK